MCTRYTLFAVVVLSLLVASCAPPAVDMAAVRSTIDGYNAALTSSVMGGSIDSVLAYIADDGAFLPPNEPPAKGKEAIRAWMTNMPPGMKITAASFTSTDVNAGGTIAYEIGNWSMTVAIDGVPEPMVNSGNHTSVWKQQTDGSWKLHSVVWNSTVPLPVPEPPKDAKKK